MTLSPPDEVSGTLSLVVEKWGDFQVDQFSPVVCIGGYPWRLRLFKNTDNKLALYLICDKPNESELWNCRATIYLPANFLARREMRSLDYSSWNEISNTIAFHSLSSLTVGTKYEFVIATKNDERRWRRRPLVDFFAPRNGVIVIGVNKKNMHVNKKSLTTESPFFYRCFHENNMNKVHIEDVEYEEFSNVLKLFYGLNDASLTDNNVLSVLQLAHRFEFKIVKDRIVSFLLSSACTLPALPFTEKYFFSRDPNSSKLLEYSRPVIEKSSTSSIENKGRPLMLGGNGEKVRIPDDPTTPHFWDEGYNPPPIEGHNSVSDSTFIDGINLGKKSKNTDKICRSLVKECNLEQKQHRGRRERDDRDVESRKAMNDDDWYRGAAPAPSRGGGMERRPQREFERGPERAPVRERNEQLSANEERVDNWRPESRPVQPPAPMAAASAATGERPRLTLQRTKRDEPDTPAPIRENFGTRVVKRDEPIPRREAAPAVVPEVKWERGSVIKRPDPVPAPPTAAPSGQQEDDEKWEKDGPKGKAPKETAAPAPSASPAWRPPHPRNDGAPWPDLGNGPRRDFGDRDGARRDFGDRDGPRRDFGGDRDGPRRAFGRGGLRRDFGDRDGPRRDFGDRDGPRRDFGDGDGPRRDFGDRDGPRRDFGGDRRPPQRDWRR